VSRWACLFSLAALVTTGDGLRHDHHLAFLPALLHRHHPRPADFWRTRPGHGRARVQRQQPPSGARRRVRRAGRDRQVTFTFNRVPGAVAYRAFRMGKHCRISDWGQPGFLVTDASPCQNANYQI
jgi:hypothetical protein